MGASNVLQELVERVMAFAEEHNMQVREEIVYTDDTQDGKRVFTPIRWKLSMEGPLP